MDNTTAAEQVLAALKLLEKELNRVDGVASYALEGTVLVSKLSVEQDGRISALERRIAEIEGDL